MTREVVSSVPQENVVTEYISRRDMWRLLERYARRSMGGMSRQPGAPGRLSGAAERCYYTVAAKLGRAPRVEQMLWMEQSLHWLRNVFAYFCSKRWACSVNTEPVEVQRIVRRSGYSEARILRGVNALRNDPRFQAEETLLVIELSAAMNEDAAFRSWVWFGDEA